MENTTQIVNLISSCISLLGLIYLWFWKFRQSRIDQFRQNIFMLRDELFDFAAKGNISFNDPAYIMLRTMMNGYIRFGHKISLSHFAITTVLTRLFNKSYNDNSFDKKFHAALSGLDKKTSERMKAFESQTSLELFDYVFLSSWAKWFVAIIPLSLLVLYFTVFLSKKEKLKLVKTKRRDVKIENQLDVLAYNYSTRSEKFQESIESFNAGAYAYGNKDVTVESSYLYA